MANKNFPQLIPRDYQQLFSSAGMSFLTSDIFMDYYKNLDALCLFAHDKWTSFLPKKVIEKTLIEGLALFGDVKLFSEFRDAIHTYYSTSEKVFESVLAQEIISHEQ